MEHQVTPQNISVSNVPIQLAVAPVGAEMPGKVPKKHQSTFYGIGIAEVVTASLCLICGIVVVSLNYNYYSDGGLSYVSNGIWCTATLLVTGILAIRIKSNNSRCLLIANMVMAIITSLFMVTSIGISVTASIVYGIGYRSQHVVASAFHALISIGSFVGLILSIVHASICCCYGVCCNGQGYNFQYGYVSSQNGNNVIVLQDNASALRSGQTMQYGFAPNPSMMPPNQSMMPPPPTQQYHDVKAPLPAGGECSTQSSMPPPYYSYTENAHLN